MGEHTKIQWCDATFNPWIGCTKVSPGCDHCYAEGMARRLGVKWNTPYRLLFDNEHWSKPRTWDRRAAREGRRMRVFCASMADVFDNQIETSERDRLWKLISETPNLDWLLLTKRIGNAARMLPVDWGRGYPNVWLGISVVNQDETDRDVPKLIETRAAIRFLSCEPLLSRIDLCAQLGMWWNQTMECWEGTGQTINCDVWDRKRIDWVIVGGESGFKARPMETRWAASLREQCRGADVAFFMKQGSQNGWGAFRNIETFPQYLQVREWPVSAAKECGL